jgi:hypothetical protein
MSTNGWGKGSVNNTNGWGAGAINNDNGWGDSQLRSWSGDTDIDGGTGIPVNTVAPVISGTTTLGSVLTTTNGTWTAKPAATFTYQWKRNGSNIVGATNSTYTIVNDDGTTNITCEVTATNDFGSASATSNTLAIPAFTDADAQAFITAASITNPTQQSAINTLVTDLKGYGVWTKMKALYPFVGGTASSHKFNLKDPRDLDAAFRLVFNGGWTHSSNGALPNGTNAFADTKFQPSNSDYTNFNWGYYLRTNSISGNEFGVNQGPGIIYDYPKLDTNGYLKYGGASEFSFLGGDTRGLHSLNQASNQLKRFRNGVLINTWSNSIINLSTNVLINYYIAARNNNGTAANFSNRERAFQYISDGLTDTEAANFYTAVQNFQVTLGRSIGTQTVSDADAQAFVTNAGIVDQVEADAINNLVIGLKADGLWSKMKAVYPFVGSSATSNSYNLKNTAQYQITWNGGLTHSSTGVLSNDINGYGNTGLNPSTVLSLNSTHLSYYSRTNTNGSEDVEIGISIPPNRRLLIAPRFVGSSSAFRAVNDAQVGPGISPSDTRGLFIASRINSTQTKLYRNTSTLFTDNVNSGDLANGNIFVLVYNTGSLPPVHYSSRECAFASIGDGLTDTDATNLNTRVQAFQTTLNRQV